MKIESNTPALNDVIEANKRLALRRAEIEAKQAGASGNAIALLDDRISICIDTSGSMGALFEGNIDRINAANQGLQAIILASDPKKTAYSIIEIDSRSKVTIPFTNNYIKIQSHRYDGMGGTDGYGALYAAKSQTPKPSRVIILTDGEWYDNNRCFNLAEAAPIIPIDTIAIGDAGDKFLIELSRITGGTFKRVTTVSEMKEHFTLLEPRNYLQLTHIS